MAEKIKKEKKQKFKKPNPFIWFLLLIVSKIWMFFISKVKCEGNALKKRNKKEGAIVLFNHQTNQDHFICAQAAGFNRLSFVVSDYYMRKPFTNFILKLARAIPKVQFRTDLVSIRKMKRAVDHKGLLTIAPAGQVTLHGEVTYVDPSIVKLLKLCKVDVYATQIRGGYICFPKWRKNRKSRKSKIRVKIVKVLTKEQVASMSDQELFDKVFEAISLSEHELKKIEPIKIKNPEPIEGLENVLYVCPKCKSKFTNVSNVNEIKCNKCGNTIYMDEYARIHPKTKDDICFENESVWYNYQGELIKERFAQDDFMMENNFKLFQNPNNPKVMEEVGSGKLTMTKSALYYDGTVLGEEVHKEFSFDTLTQLPFSPGHHFEVPDGDGVFQFRPLDEPGTVVEWVQTIDTINSIKRN